MKPELLPCPLCGQEASIETRNVSLGGGDTAFWVGVGCPSDDLNHTARAHRLGPGWYGGRTEEGDASLLTEAVKAWNTRAAPATDEALVEVVARAILGPHNPVPAGSQYTLDELREIRWNNSTEAEQAEALWQARAAIAAMQADITARESVNTKVMELPMTAFADQHPVRDELMGEQTILIHTAAATWDLRFFETSESFPERWFGEHWIDITEMWPGVTAQVTEFHKINEQAIRNKALDEAAARCADRVARAEQAIRICPKKDAEFHREARDTAKFLGTAILALKEQHNG